jgi:hypothetical protein
MKKLLVRLVMAVVVLVIVVGVIGYFWLDVIAKEAVQRGGTYAMGVDTTVDKVSLHPFAGQLQMTGLTVANPPSFNGAHLMQTGTFELELVPASLMDKTIVLKKFELDGLDMYVDQKMPLSNIAVIMDNLKKLAGGEKPKDEKPSEGKKVRVDLITIRNVVAHVKVLVGPELTIKVPLIELKNVTGDNAVGVALPELVARIVPAVLAAVLESGKGVLPADLMNNLQGSVSAVTAKLGGQAQEMVKGVQGQVGSALKGVLPVDANGIGGQLNKTIGGTVGKLLGGAKDANQDANKPKAPGGGLLDGILGGKKK